jgi:hypothetical protein
MRKNQGFLELRRLEAARDIAEQLSQGNNKVMLDSGTLLLDGTFACSCHALFFLLTIHSVTKEGAKDLMGSSGK